MPDLTTEQAERFLREQFLDDKFLQFIRALVDADVLTTDARGDQTQFVYFLEKPWKYADEFVAWDKAGAPLDDSEPGWDEFLDAIAQ